MKFYSIVRTSPKDGVIEAFDSAIEAAERGTPISRRDAEIKIRLGRCAFHADGHLPKEPAP